MKAKGYLCGIFAAVTWGTVFFVGRIVMKDGSVNPVVLAFWRCFFASLFLLILLRRRVKNVIPAVKKDWVNLLYLSCVGIFLFNMLVFSSLRYTTATSSSILMNSNPLFILLLSAIFLHEKINFNKIFAVFIGFSGCIMVIKGTSGISLSEANNLLRGNFFAIGAALCWAIYTVGGRNPTWKYGAIVTTFVTLSTGMLLLLANMLVQGIDFLNVRPAVFLAGAYLGIVPAGIGFTLWYNALKYMEPGELGILQYLASVVTAVLAIIFLKELPSIFVIAGMILIFLALYIPKNREKT
ncbi:MAG: EamA family transporter [Candidatus Omnitrophica bacterium]|nr:EamA family transporter [Candidatus Omnitrophota bacterium]